MWGRACSRHISRKSENSSKLELYCCSCESLLCYECALEHQNPQHQVKTLKDCVTPFKKDVCKEVNSLVQELKGHSPGKASISGEIDNFVRCESEQEDFMKVLESKSRELLECNQGLITSIKTVFVYLLQILREKESMLLPKGIECLRSHIETIHDFMKYLEFHPCDEAFVSIICARIEQLRENYSKS